MANAKNRDETTQGSTGRTVRLVPANDEADLSIDLHEGINRIGRQRVDNHIVLVSPQVSRFHAEIEVKPDGIVVRDLGSANGTFVNNERVAHRVLAPGDMVGFSEQFTLRLEIDSAAAGQPDSMTLSGLRGAIAGSSPGAERGPLQIGPDIVPESLARRSAELQLSEEDLLRRGDVADVADVADPPPELPPEQQTAKEYKTLDMAKLSPAGSAELNLVERERQQLSTLFQISKQCMSARSLPELDRLLINVLERTVVFDRGFIAYQLPSGDWKLVMAPKGIDWDRDMVRSLLQISLAAEEIVLVEDSRVDLRLGQPPEGTDQRLLLPLRTRDMPVGMMFVICTTPDALKSRAVDFLSLFSEIAALAITHCAQIDQ